MHGEYKVKKHVTSKCHVITDRSIHVRTYAVLPSVRCCLLYQCVRTNSSSDMFALHYVPSSTHVRLLLPYLPLAANTNTKHQTPRTVQSLVLCDCVSPYVISCITVVVDISE
jgi:hypothetical protein